MDLRETEGAPKNLVADLESFREDALYLANRRRELTRRYAEQWVAVYSSRVRARAETLDELLEAIDRKGLPRDGVVVDFLTKEPRTLVV